MLTEEDKKELIQAEKTFFKKGIDFKSQWEALKVIEDILYTQGIQLKTGNVSELKQCIQDALKM